MGVYHVSGLGISPGAVTSVLHYIADRLSRRQSNDEAFFGQSGEWRHRQEAAGQSARPAGYLQGLVLLTTPEIFSGKLPVRIQQGGVEKEYKVLDVVKSELRKHHRHLTGGVDSPVEFCIVQVPFRDFDRAFDRSLDVLHSLHTPGKTGKEVWLNLTAGDNTLMLALNLAAALTGSVARLYCINVAKDKERELRHPVKASHIGTENDRFWIDLPVLAVQDHELRTLVLRTLEAESQPLDDKKLCGLVRQQWLRANQPLPEIEQFRRQYLHPMQSQQLIQRVDEHVVQIGPAWERIRRFYLKASGEPTATSIRDLASKHPDWAHWEEIE